MEKDCYWVYILNCSNGSYYTGYTTDLARRYQEHLQGSLKSKYTRSFKPLALAQAWQVYGTKAAAMRVEQFIKRLARQEKEQFILNPQSLAQCFKGECQVKPSSKCIVGATGGRPV